MCNAHNHPPGCMCGWGGDGHLGGGRGGGNLSWLSASPYCIHEDGFCRPTTCPKCGASVFFIRHNGGCLWVDELGKPWDKHPCFDNADLPKSTINLHRCLQALTEQSSDAIICMVASGSVNARTGNLEIAVMTSDQAILALELTAGIKVSSIDHPDGIDKRSPLELILEGKLSPAAIHRIKQQQKDDLNRRVLESDAITRFWQDFTRNGFRGWDSMIGQMVFLDKKQRTLRWPASMQVSDARFNAGEAHDFEITISFPVKSVRKVK